MQPTNSMQEFIQKNDKELRYMASSLCYSHGLPKASENDVIQDFYLKALTGSIIESYDPNFNRGGSKNPKMSTYLYPIISNLIKTTRKQPENRLQHNRFIADPSIEESYDMDEIELALQFNQVAVDYEGVFLHNNISDNIEAELKDFETKFLKDKDNKKYKLRKRKNKSLHTKGLSILDVYNYLKHGMSSREIAGMYGVSDMFICQIKKRIGKSLIKHGIKWDYSKKLTAKQPAPEIIPAPVIPVQQSIIKDWTEADIIQLKELYKTKSMIAVAKEMGRSICSIKCKLYKLKIKKS